MAIGSATLTASSGAARRAAARSIIVVTMCYAVAGCGASGDPGAIFIDPGRYDAYRCNDLTARWKVLTDRERELRGLMDRANEANGGAVVSSLAYRTDYESVRSEERLLLRVAADKNCSFTPEYESDQTVR